MIQLIEQIKYPSNVVTFLEKYPRAFEFYAKQFIFRNDYEKALERGCSSDAPKKIKKEYEEMKEHQQKYGKELARLKAILGLREHSKRIEACEKLGSDNTHFVNFINYFVNILNNKIERFNQGKCSGREVLSYENGEIYDFTDEEVDELLHEVADVKELAEHAVQGIKKATTRGAKSQLFTSALSLAGEMSDTDYDKKITGLGVGVIKWNKYSRQVILDAFDAIGGYENVDGSAMSESDFKELKEISQKYNHGDYIFRDLLTEKKGLCTTSEAKAIVEHVMDEQVGEFGERDTDDVMQ